MCSYKLAISRICNLSILSCIVIIYQVSAIAQSADKCVDILRDGTMSKSRIFSNDYLHRVVLSRFARMTYEESKTDRSFDANVPTGEIILGANYSESQFSKKQEDIRNQLDTDLTVSKLRDIALVSGDPAIIGAWSKCMGENGGLSLRYELNSPTSITAYVEWFSPRGSGINDVTLIDDVRIPPGIDRTASDLECLKKGVSIKASSACISTIYLNSAKTPLVMVAKAASPAGRVADAVAYLPPRLKLITKHKPYDFGPAKDGSRPFFYEDGIMSGSGSRTITRQLDPGRDGEWQFDPKTASYEVTTVRALDRSWCRKDFQQIDANQITFSMHILSNDSAATQVCRLYPKVDLVQERWVESDSPDAR